MTPLLREMLDEMRRVLTFDDIRAGIPEPEQKRADVSPLYMHWEDLKRRAEMQETRIAELDQDIQQMSVWDDYPMSRIDQLARQGQSLRFWRASQFEYNRNRREWEDNYQAEIVAFQDDSYYFVTTTPLQATIVLQGADEVTICPSPVSTLITLQTQAKDSLRRTQLEIGDFALQHYRSVEAALGLHDTLVIPTKRRRFWNRLVRVCRFLLRRKKIAPLTCLFLLPSWENIFLQLGK